MNKRKKQLKEIRRNWGKENNSYRNFDLIEQYHEFVKNDTCCVDERTSKDLELQRLFAKLDRTSSGPGQQYLYHLLHTYQKDSIIDKRLANSEYFIQHDRERELIQLELLKISSHSAYYMPFILFNETLPSTKYLFIYYLLAAISLISLMSIPIHGYFLFATLALILLNIILNKVHSSKIYEYFTGFQAVNNLMITARRMSKIKTNQEFEQTEVLRTNFSKIRSLNKSLGKLVFDKSLLPEPAGIFLEYINMILNLDVIAYYRSVRKLNKYRELVNLIFRSIAELDCMISMASFKSSASGICRPEFTGEDKISFKGLYHPLVTNAISNSISEIEKSILVTGSNMAGKTTFIKTIGLNVILAQTLGICFARRFSLPRMKVKSSIRREENPEESKSYFFVEIEELNRFIELSGSGDKFLFLIDEIFRGTNTIERISSSVSVLRYLNDKNFVFVTTHDIELQHLLREFDMYHFSEQVEGNKFFFDYKIKQGPCTSGNAIKLLEIKGYPESIVKDASELSKKLLQTNILDIERLREI